MCNFVIRPIKSYATVDIDSSGGVPLIKAGDVLQVEKIEGTSVVGMVNDAAGVEIPLEVFVHAFTANPDDTEKVRKQEWKAMGYDPEKKDKKSK